LDPDDALEAVGLPLDRGAQFAGLEQRRGHHLPGERFRLQRGPFWISLTNHPLCFVTDHLTRAGDDRRPQFMQVVLDRL
jgi:hypothetical protein